jgi:hypothetical protein
MLFTKGHPKYGGRRRGRPNKVSPAAKEVLRRAFEDVGGYDAFVA